MDILYVHFTDVPKNANAIKSHDFSYLFASRTNTSTIENPNEKTSYTCKDICLNYVIIGNYYPSITKICTQNWY